MTNSKRFTATAFVAVAALSAACSIGHLGPIEVAPTGGAGFAGVRTYELLQQPAFSLPPACTGPQTPQTVCSPVQLLDSVDLIPNHHYEWRPALSTGVSFQHYAKTAPKLGGGVGLNVVMLSDVTGKTSPWPAATLHFGTHESGFFAGLIISPTDGIAHPGGVSVIRVQRDHIPNLILPNTGRAGHLYLGIRIGGKNVGDSTSR